MERGEFSAADDQLKFHGVYAETPSDFIDVLGDDFFWRDLSWLAIAKFVRVQIHLWIHDGWAVPSRVRRGLPERGMTRHGEAGGQCGTCDELVGVLLAGHMKKKLDAV